MVNVHLLYVFQYLLLMATLDYVTVYLYVVHSWALQCALTATREPVLLQHCHTAPKQLVGIAANAISVPIATMNATPR